jgi:hypothetical protein
MQAALQHCVTYSCLYALISLPVHHVAWQTVQCRAMQAALQHCVTYSCLYALISLPVLLVYCKSIDVFFKLLLICTAACHRCAVAT